MGPRTELWSIQEYQAINNNLLNKEDLQIS